LSKDEKEHSDNWLETGVSTENDQCLELADRDGAAVRLGIKRTTVISRMKKLGHRPRKVW
jgi:transcriptional regulator with GAF, ATPase, and Fis domain